MNKNTNEQLKDYSLFKFLWFSISALCAALFIGGEIGGFSLLSGIASSVLVLLSFPLNFLFGWLFFAYDFGSLSTLFLLAACSIAGYVQWFVLLPKLVNFVKKNLRKTSAGSDETDFLDAEQAFQLNPASLSQNINPEWMNKDRQPDLAVNKTN